MLSSLLVLRCGGSWVFVSLAPCVELSFHPLFGFPRCISLARLSKNECQDTGLDGWPLCAVDDALVNWWDHGHSYSLNI